MQTENKSLLASDFRMIKTPVKIVTPLLYLSFLVVIVAFIYIKTTTTNVKTETVLGTTNTTVTSLFTDKQALSLIEKYPNYPYSYYHFAQKELKKGNLSEAQKWYDLALDHNLDPELYPLVSR